MSAHEDSADVNSWLKVILAEPLSLTQRMALSNLAALCLRRAIEAAELRERLDGRPSAPVLRLVAK